MQDSYHGGRELVYGIRHMATVHGTTEHRLTVYTKYRSSRLVVAMQYACIESIPPKINDAPYLHDHSSPLTSTEKSPQGRFVKIL